MNAWVASAVAFVTMAVAMAAGMAIGSRLSETRYEDGSVKNLRTSVAIIATMSSLLLGLMVNSARYNFSDAYSDVQKYAAVLQITDLNLLSFGAPACPLRGDLQAYARQLVAETWTSGDDEASSGAAQVSALAALLKFDTGIRNLKAGTSDQQDVRSTLLGLSRQLVEYRWKVTGVARTATPVTFIFVVICWFALIFLYSGVFAPRNALVLTGHALGMVGISAAIFLVMEMGQPFTGPIKVSPAPVERLLLRMQAQPCPAVTPQG
ncbi:bestrophin-like domain [Xanthobacter flavus]|uniref:bestrophin-like domain n=1 Tax=Xanthobacter flavus TaxID=281 RepID=UPI0037264881